MLFRFQFLIIDIHSKVYTNQFKTKQILPKTGGEKSEPYFRKSHMSFRQFEIFTCTQRRHFCVAPFLPCFTRAWGP